MQQLQLTIDQDSQLLNELVSTVRSPTLSRSAKLAEIGRILAHFDLPIEAPRVAGQEALDAAAHEAATSPRNDRP